MRGKTLFVVNCGWVWCGGRHLLVPYIGGGELVPYRVPLQPISADRVAVLRQIESYL